MGIHKILTDDQVAEISAAWSAGEKQKTLAARYFVSQNTISKALRETIKLCVDCKKPLSAHATRCEECLKQHMRAYNQRYYHNVIKPKRLGT